MQIEKKTLRKIFWGVAALILLYWALHETDRFSDLFGKLWEIISPFVIGAALAFILNVPMRAIEKLLKGVKRPGLRRALAMVLTVLAVLLVLTGVFWLLIPQLITTAESLIESLPGFYEDTMARLTRFLTNHPELQEILNEYTDFGSIDWSALLEKMISFVSGGISSVADYLYRTVAGLFSGIFNAMLSLAFCMYSLARKEILARQGRRILYSFLPEKASDEIIRILRMSNATFSGFISGQCLEALILGCMFAITMPIFKMPYVVLISVIISVMALVPIVGAFVGCAVGAFLILTQNPLQAVWFVVLFLVLQMIEENVFYPKVVGDSVGLPGMWVLVAVGVGGGLMGVAGMLIMIPLTSVLYALAREITNKRLEDREIDPEKLKDQPPEILSKFREKRQVRKAKRQKRREERKIAKGKKGVEPEEDDDDDESEASED